ncbi:O-acyltransferase WSD1 [Hondaea fermentalgiana]|uniref:O-acyltransferase WSD1 n=1 Tax=Hondaea fermentalgiana TaxID=2315210 RepID=A0A2R5GFX1_9STRA|nr:O-acyltransferase WSD1 [Hondaea fermentalgiana]|eukprot:GBG28658.1 O-acyltransferase WSD1 [Hondaea fermentalgiana]
MLQQQQNSTSDDLDRAAREAAKAKRDDEATPQTSVKTPSPQPSSDDAEQPIISEDGIKPQMSVATYEEGDIDDNKRTSSQGFARFPDEVLDRVDSQPGMKRRASIVSKIFSSLQDEAQHKSVWITGILLLAENPGIDKLRNEMAHRLLSIPRFRSVVQKKSASAPAYFTEIEMSDIDMNYHFQTILDESTPSREDIHAYVSSMYETWTPDLTKPLWQILFVPRTHEGGAAIVTRINHAIGDGISQVEILMRLIDGDDEADGATSTTAKQQLPTKRERAKTFGPLNRTGIFLGGVSEGLTAIMRAPDAPNSLKHGAKGATSLKRKYAFTEKIPLDRIKSIKSKLDGATINDVLMLVLNETLHRYYQEAGDEAVLRKGRITAQFPVSTRSRNAEAFRNDDPCNSIAYGYLTFRFTKRGSMIDRFWRIKRDIDKIKLSPAPYVGIRTLRGLSPVLSRNMLNKLALGVGTLATGQLSNVVAPQEAVHICGARVDDMSFVLLAPTSLYMGLLSYNGFVNCAICLNGDLPADPSKVVRHWGEVFADFEREVLAHDGDLISRPRRFMDKF